MGGNSDAPVAGARCIGLISRSTQPPCARIAGLESRADMETSFPATAKRRELFAGDVDDAVASKGVEGAPLTFYPYPMHKNIFKAKREASRNDGKYWKKHFIYQG